VTAEVQAVAGASTQVTAAAQRVVFPAGARTAQVQIPVVDNTTPEKSADTAYRVVVAAPVNGVVEENVTRIVVHDDDQPAVQAR
jgi:hypothetical protein